MRTTTTAAALSSFLIIIGCVSAWTTTNHSPSPSIAVSSSTSSLASSRRQFIDQAVKIVPLIALASPAFADDDVEPVVAAALAPEPEPEAAPAPVVAPPAPEPAAAPVAPEPEPAATTAVDTDDNPFIARLKAQSEANAEKYKKDAQRSDKLSKQQFKDQYKRPTYYGIRTKDSTDASQSIMVLKPELDELLASGKVIKSFESKMNKKSGEISDDYSKPIFVFTE